MFGCRLARTRGTGTSPGWQRMAGKGLGASREAERGLGARSGQGQHSGLAYARATSPLGEYLRHIRYLELGGVQAGRHAAAAAKDSGQGGRSGKVRKHRHLREDRFGGFGDGKRRCTSTHNRAAAVPSCLPGRPKQVQPQQLIGRSPFDGGSGTVVVESVDQSSSPATLKGSLGNRCGRRVGRTGERRGKGGKGRKGKRERPQWAGWAGFGLGAFCLQGPDF